MSVKKPNPHKEEYMKERKRVQRIVREAKKRGHVFSEDVVPPIPKKITQGSINRLKRITPEKIYTKSTVERKIVDSTGTPYFETVSGSKFEAERKKKTRKQTSKRTTTPKRKNRTKYTKPPVKIPSTTFEKKDKSNVEVTPPDEQPLTLREFLDQVEEMSTEDARAALLEYFEDNYGLTNIQDMLRFVDDVIKAFPNDTPTSPVEQGTTPTTYTQSDIELANNLENTVDVENFQQGQLILERINELIDQFSGSIGSDLLKKLLKNSIENYGENAVASTLSDIEANNSELIAQMQNVIFYPERHNSGAVSRAYKSLADAIKMHDVGGEAYAKYLGEAIESLQYYDSIK